MSKNIAKWFRGLDISWNEFSILEKKCIDIYQSYKANLPIEGIHFQPLYPARKRTLFQMLRLEQHFEKKKQKLGNIDEKMQQELEGKSKGRTKGRADSQEDDSSLNTMRFSQL